MAVASLSTQLKSRDIIFDPSSHVSESCVSSLQELQLPHLGTATYPHLMLLDIPKPLISSIVSYLVPDWTSVTQSSTILQTQQQQSFGKCKIVSHFLQCSRRSRVMLSLCCNHYTGFQFPSESTYAGNPAIEDTFHTSTDLPLSTPIQSLLWLGNVTVLF